MAALSHPKPAVLVLELFFGTLQLVPLGEKGFGLVVSHYKPLQTMKRNTMLLFSA